MGDWVDDCRCMCCSGGHGGKLAQAQGAQKALRASLCKHSDQCRAWLCISLTRSLGTAAGAGTAWLGLGANEEGHRGRKNNDQEELLSGVSFFIHY